MRILHIVHQYPPEHVGGTELYTQSLAQRLSLRGHQITVFHRQSTEGSGEGAWAEGDVQVRAAGTRVLDPARRFLATFRDPLIVRAFERVLEEACPDLVHVQHLMGLPAALLRPVQQRGLPYVITLHDYWWVCANAQLLTNYSQQACEGPQAYVNCSRCALARAGHPGLWPALPALPGPLAWRNHLLRQILKAASKIIAPTEFVCSWYADHGVPTEKLIVIPHGIEGPPLESRQKRSPNDHIRFVYIGGLSWQKGVHTLVEAFRGIEGRVELWIAGDESFDLAYTSRLHAQASSNVTFLGKLTRQEVWERLTQADAVVVPSLWYETFSLIVHEAFAVGVPVIASHLGALTEVVRDGVDGLLLPPGDVAAWRAALQRLVAEPDLLAQLRANVRPPTTLEEHVGRLESLYAQVVDSSG